MLRFLQSHPAAFIAALAAAAVALVANVWSELAGPPSLDTAHPAIARTAWIASAAWYAAMALRLFAPVPLVFRGVYAWGCAAYLLHVAVAFHLGHAWSHAAAFEHVEHASGFGAGIFVSYAFTLTWTLDAAWSAAAWTSYRERGRAWNIAIYGFMAFVVVNATLVFPLINRI